jgi:hypothetical protein
MITMIKLCFAPEVKLRERSTPYGLPTGSLRAPYGLPTGSLRAPYGLPTGSLRECELAMSFFFFLPSFGDGQR